MALPQPPDPADVTISAQDIAAERDMALLLPPVPEPAPVDLDLARDGAPGALAAAVPEAGDPADRLAAAATPESSLDASAAADIAVTVATETAGPVGGQVASREHPAAQDAVASLPPPPEAAPVDLSGASAAPGATTASTNPVAEPVFSSLAATAKAPLAPNAAAPPAPEHPAPALAAAEAPPLATMLAARLADGLKLSVLPAREAQALVAFYAERSHRPMWHDGGKLTAEARIVMAHLARAEDDGLRAADYALHGTTDSLAGLAEADLMLSIRAVQYARDARGARINPRRLSALITPKMDLPGASDVLAALASSPDPARTLAAFHPAQPGYLALKAKLVELRAARQAVAEPLPVIPPGPVLRVGMRDDRIQLLRSRFGLGVGPSGGEVYDRSLSTVVASFQKENGLPVNGILTRGTQAALNGAPRSGLEADIIANMERWRWLPADLGDDHLVVNVPEYMVRKVEAGAIVHEARVVVGKSERPTPIFSDMMDHLVLNPSWTVPPTILKQDYLPKLEADPGYAERRGMQVIRRGNQITLRQPPGPTNALGSVKFMFPNDHAVYLHDTPSRSLFASARRAYSSGCVRVERPLKLAELVLGGTDGGWSERRLSSLVGAGERTIRLSRKLPIHIIYMTMTVTPSGEIRTHEDIYGFHRRTREALGL